MNGYDGPQGSDHSTRTYRVERRRMLVHMGGKCVHCGCADLDQLEPGHIQPRDWIPSRVNQMRRLRLYWRDWLVGIIQVECRACNNKMNGLMPRWKQLNRIAQRTLDLATDRE